MTTATKPTPAVALSVGRLRTHPSGIGFCIVADPNEPDGPIMGDPDAPHGLTYDEAEFWLDYLDFKAKRN